MQPKCYVRWLRLNFKRMLITGLGQYTLYGTGGPQLFCKGVYHSSVKYAIFYRHIKKHGRIFEFLSIFDFSQIEWVFKKKSPIVHT